MSLGFRTYIKKGHRYGAIVESFRDPATGKSRTTSIVSFGNLDKLQETDPDFMTRINEELRRLNQDEAYYCETSLTKSLAMHRKSDFISTNYSPAIRFGEIILRRCWEELGLNKLFGRIRTEQNLGYDVDAAAYCLASDRMRTSGSKKRCFVASRLGLFNYSSLSLEDLYSVLDVLHTKKSRIITWLNSHIDKLNQRELSVVLYDVTTFYFESFTQDNVRNHGMSKEHRTAETQVVLGLLIDTNGIPVDYELFSGNTHEMGTLLQVVNGFISRYGPDKLTIVADAGLNSKDNLLQMSEQGLTFIVAQSMRKLPQRLQDHILQISQESWDFEPGCFDEWRTCEVPFPIECIKTDEHNNPVLDANGRKVKVKLNTRLIVNFSAARYKKDMADIQKLVAKAKKMLAQGNGVIESGKARRYPLISKFGLDDNGQATDKPVKGSEANYTYGLNTKLIEDRKKVAGYYAFITNDPLGSKSEQYCKLRTLWKIEACFRVMKTFLKARPVYVRTEAHIRGHFVMCYMALVIEQLCLSKLKAEYDPTFSTERLIALVNAPMFSKVLSPLRSSQLLYKQVDPQYYEATGMDLKELSAKLDQALACFGVKQLLNIETASSAYKKLGVNLKLNKYLTLSTS